MAQVIFVVYSGVSKDFAMSKRVIIIGAGIGGIATANLLAKAGYTVDVYEQNDKPGGRARKFTTEGFTFDAGPSWYLMPDVFEQYFSIFGLSTKTELDLVRLSPAYKVFFEQSDPLVITGDITKDAQTFEAIEKGAGKKLRTYVDRADGIYRLSVKHFLYTNFSSVRDFLAGDIIKHGMRMLYLASTTIDRYVRSFVTDLRLRQILEYPMVFLGSSPYSTPAIYSLMSALDFREGVFYPKGGLNSVIDSLMKLSRTLGVTYHYSTPVRQITSSKGVATGIVLQDGTSVAADIVISNADLHHTETALLAKTDQSYPESYWKKKQAGPSALLLYLGVEGTLPQLEHHNLFFTRAWKQNFEAIFKTKQIPDNPSLYVCKPSATDSGVAPKNTENLFVLVPLPPDVMLRDNLQHNADRFLSLISDVMKIPDLQKRIIVQEMFGPDDFCSTFNAWQGTALGPSHTLRQSAFLRTANKSKKVQNLYYVGGSTTPGIGLPMCLISAELVYKRIIGDTHGGPVETIEKVDGAGQ